MKIVDAARLLEEGRWGGYQKLLILGTALSVLLVGVANQIIGPSIPAMMKAWSLDRAAFSSALAAGPIGFMFGSLFGGMLSDRIGRRSTLILSALAFGIATLAIAGVNGIPMLTVLRLLSGVGFGSALANAAVLAFEYVPKRQGALAVALTATCIPVGGFLAASISSSLLPGFGWRALFLLCGIIPIIFALVAFKAFPESPLYLASRRERWPELIALLRRLDHTLPDDVVFAGSGSSETSKSRTSIRDLILPGFRLDTLGMFGAFFFSLLAAYLGIQWLPIWLTGQGLTPPQAVQALKVWNIGGIGGTLVCALLIQRLGSGIAMRGTATLSIVCALVLATTPIDPKETLSLMVMLGVLGGLVNAVQTNMYALAANIYPAAIRGTGLGTAMAVGRIGSLMAGYIGAALFAGGTRSYFASFAVAMALALVSLALVRRHIHRILSPARVHS